MSEEVWGPWMVHDGKGCPVEASAIVEAYDKEGDFYEADTADSLTWEWLFLDYPECHIIRYRIRKPRGLTILESLLADLPERVDA